MTSSSDLPSLNHGGKNWVTKAGGLPKYIDRIARHLKYEKGMPEGEAIATAKNVCEHMCQTGDLNFPGIQHAAPPHQAAACDAIAEWNAKRAQSHVTK